MEIDIKYSLIPKKPKKGEKIFAYAHIHKLKNEIIYEVIEPKLTESLKNILEEIKNIIIDTIDVDLREIKKKEAKTYLENAFFNALKYIKKNLTQDDIEILKYYVFRDFFGLGKIEPLLNDSNIEDISCDGINIPVYVYHRNPSLGSLKTNIVFSAKQELDNFVIKLAERCGKTISISKPLLNSTLPDGSRVQATLGTDIARHGSNFTIRMFTEKPLTPIDIIKYKTCDYKTMAFLWLAIEHGRSILISGGTATGKTSLLNAIALFIRPEMKIVSIEDTAEIRLVHEHWIPEVARTVIGEREEEVDMYDLLKESLRQRPDYIIVGEVRGKEAYVLFQQIATGHPGLGTIHAEDFPRLIDRLTTKPISLPPSLLENLDLVVFLKRLRKEGKYIRRVTSLVEVVGYSRKKQEPFFNEIVKWDPKTDTFISVGKSVVLKQIAETLALSIDEIYDEFKLRAYVLKWMVKNNIIDYRDVSNYISMFYNNKEKLIKVVL